MLDGGGRDDGNPNHRTRQAAVAVRRPARVESDDGIRHPDLSARPSPRPAWQGDNHGIIADATEALAYLCGERKPQYITTVREGSTDGTTTNANRWPHASPRWPCALSAEEMGPATTSWATTTAAGPPAPIHDAKGRVEITRLLCDLLKALARNFRRTPTRLSSNRSGLRRHGGADQRANRQGEAAGYDEQRRCQRQPADSRRSRW